MKHRIGAGRPLFALICMLAILGVISWRLFDISWRRHAWYSQTAQAQANGVSNVLMRGTISLTDRGGQQRVVATNRAFPALILNAAKFDRSAIDATAGTVAGILGGERESIATLMRSTTSGTKTIAKKITDEQANAIKAANIRGVTIAYETDRSYPAGMLAADAIGFLGYGQNGREGQYGVEASYETELSGRLRSGGGWNIGAQLGKLFGRSSTSAEERDDRPLDVELTLDATIQAYAQTVLDGVLKKYQAASGVLLVQDPTSGRMLAMADSPSFDPNRYGSFPVASFMNGALVPFEPGSSVKPFTMAMGLDLGKITPSTVFDDQGPVQIDGYTIKNFNEQSFGKVTMTKVLEKSINTGVMWVETLIGNDAFLKYAVDLGFGQRTGIDLPGEASGDISNLYSGRRINFLTASFGQGLTVTPLQLVNGYSAIANGGKLMRPYVVGAVVDELGNRTETKPEMIGTPFTAKTAAQLRTMLTSVVDNGFDKARIPRYDVAGKTGTAQIASPTGGYLEKQYNHSFVGFAPASDPKFVILIKMEKPQGITFAADSLSPAFKDMALFLLNYFNIPPTR
ncbi:MAG: penicillin-binding protein 2 [Candidatus Yanofskybacteria bacterium]|nr:penicillin-binding protein 2 [Candidatus Yanofskybacteria bacterium]